MKNKNSAESLVKELKEHNRLYRLGISEITDLEYDALIEKLTIIDPEHAFLNTVEPEKFSKKRKVFHEKPMLSIAKAYKKEEIKKFIERVKKSSKNIGFNKEIIFKVTPKLDGLAGYDSGTVFTTRGDGISGFEISSYFKRGLVAVSGRAKGFGEIVVSKSYFETEKLDKKFSHPRNMVVGIIASDTFNEQAKQALTKGAIRFVPYSSLSSWKGSGEELAENYITIMNELYSKTDYFVDGIVVEVTEDIIKENMGDTGNHHKWQLAIKTKNQTGITTVEKILWQVGRTGKLTPVAKLNPIKLSGAIISKVSLHNAGMVKNLNIGAKAKIKIIRSGEVIPKLEEVLKTTSAVNIPQKCPACNKKLFWNEDFLYCKNKKCFQQTVQTLLYWFKTIGTAKNFGKKSIERIVLAGFSSIEKIFKMNKTDFVNIGFGPIQSVNFVLSLKNSLNTKVKDWKFLAALGVSCLGQRESQKILKIMGIHDLFVSSKRNIENIKGFGEISSNKIFKELKTIKPVFNSLINLGFVLETTPHSSIKSEKQMKDIVITGKIKDYNRKQASKIAESRGFKVQSGITKSTNILVYGDKSSQAKIKKARLLKIKILKAEDFFTFS